MQKIAFLLTRFHENATYLHNNTLVRENKAKYTGSSVQKIAFLLTRFHENATYLHNNTLVRENKAKYTGSSVA